MFLASQRSSNTENDRSSADAIGRISAVLLTEFSKASFVAPSEVDEAGTDAFTAFVDLIGSYLKTGDPLYRQLFEGTLRKRYRNEHLSAQQQAKLRIRMLSELRERTLAVSRGLLPREALDRLSSFFGEVRVSVEVLGRKSVRILFIGDCVYQDILSFLEGACVEDGVQIDASFVDTKNPVEACQRVSARKDRFDVIFYSPLTYEQSLPFRQIMEWRKAAMPREAVEAMLDQSIGEVDTMVGLLAQSMECPVFVHNTAGVRRHDGHVRDLVKNSLTLSLRRRARDGANARILDLLARHREYGLGHLGLIDETQLLANESEGTLGRFLGRRSRLDHPATLGARLAPMYRDRIYVVAHLLHRKLIVCDLDNTIWRGLVGEGEVQHDLERQMTLRRLRDRGVLLAINSKNDPTKVRWEGAALGPSDFVSAQINWSLKTDNMKRIQQELNLKFDDFVFVDDQSDQREMVRIVTPEVHLMDATDERSWHLLKVWADMLDERPEIDRTLMYRQRAQREQSISTRGEVSQSDLLTQLGIRVTIREARRADLRRAAELINRTNQFNMCGTRTTINELTQWQLGGSHRILLADASDKFGSNGTIAVIVLETSAEATRIACFVLSCRVFGYGIEHALINHVIRKFGGRSQPIVGSFSVTPHNEPCHAVYSQNRFTWDGLQWVYAGGLAPADPLWLTVQAVM